MLIRKGLIVLSILSVVTTLPAMARSYVDVEVAPPPAREEVIPAQRAGYVWAPGYWAWRGHRHVWVSGHWIRERHGRRWVPERWEQRGHRYHFQRGHWD